MIVYKFGGASVKDSTCKEDLIVVVSAMGKMTNAFEKVVESYVIGEDVADIKTEIFNYHRSILNDLFGKEYLPEAFMQQWSAFENELAKVPSLDFDYDYDRIVSFGELLSTTIIAEYLNNEDKTAEWIDARSIIRTSNHYREAKVLWDVSQEIASKKITFNQTRCYITQGFIGATLNNQTTTLGREGSDYSAATLAYLFDAESVTIWKDVPGVLNADPRWFPEAKLLPEITYKDATELTYYGAQVIHPKTLKPLQNKGIVLYVKSFYEPAKPGTRISEVALADHVPVYIRKDNQVLITIYPNDFSFIVENNIRDIFDVFARHRVKVSLMQNSALSFSVCANYDSRRFDEMVKELQESFAVVYNLNVEMLTIRNYKADGVKDIVSEREILVVQKTRNTACYVLA